MTLDLAQAAVDRDDTGDRISRTSTGRPALAWGALLTAVKVTLASIPILVILPAAVAAQVAIAR